MATHPHARWLLLGRDCAATSCTCLALRGTCRSAVGSAAALSSSLYRLFKQADTGRGLAGNLGGRPSCCHFSVHQQNKSMDEYISQKWWIFIDYLKVPQFALATSILAIEMEKLLFLNQTSSGSRSRAKLYCGTKAESAN